MKVMINFFRLLLSIFSVKGMKKLRYLMILLLLTFMLGGTANANFWEPAGLCGSSVFRSTNNGASCNSANAGITLAYSIEVVPCFKNRILLGGHNA